MVKKITLKAQKQNNLLLISNVTATVILNLGHAVWVAIVISTKTSRLTTYCVLAVDVLFNIYETYSIIKRHGKVIPMDENSKITNEWKINLIKLIHSTYNF